MVTKPKREWTKAEKEMLDMAGQTDEKVREAMAQALKFTDDGSWVFVKILMHWLFEKQTCPHFEAVIGKGGRITIPEPTRMRHGIKDGRLVTVTIVPVGVPEMFDGTLELAKEGKLEDSYKDSISKTDDFVRTFDPDAGPWDALPEAAKQCIMGLEKKYIDAKRQIEKLKKNKK